MKIIQPEHPYIHFQTSFKRSKRVTFVLKIEFFLSKWKQFSGWKVVCAKQNLLSELKCSFIEI